MKIRSLNERGEEEEEEQITQRDEITRSYSELLFAYSLETEEWTTSLSDDDDEKQRQQYNVAYCLQQKVGNVSASGTSTCGGNDTTLVFRQLPEEALGKQWLVNKLKIPTRTLQVSFLPGIRRRRKSRGFGSQHNFSKLLPILRKLSIVESQKDEQVVDQEEKQVCELLSSVSLSRGRRKARWTSHRAKTLGWAITVSLVP